MGAWLSVGYEHCGVLVRPRRPQHERVVRHIQELPEATPLMISAITLGEIEFGLQVASKVSTPEQEASRGSPGLYRYQFAHGA